MTHFTCKQPALDRALTTVSRALAAHPTLPILTSVLIAADDAQVTLTTTNLEIGIKVEIDAEIIEAGSFCLPAKLFQEFIHSLPADLIEVLVEAGSWTAHLKSLHSDAHIRGLDAAEYPSLPSCEKSLLVHLEAALLKEMIGQVAFATAKDDSCPVLTGILLQLRETAISLAAADAFRLAVRHAETNEREHRDLLIPGKTLGELARCLPNEGLVELLVSANQSQVLFRAPGLEVVSRLIEGNFPAYETIIPKNYTTRVVLNRSELAAAIKSAALFARENSNITKLTVKAPESDLGNGSVVLEAAAEDIGDGTSVLDASVEGPGVTMLFSSKYLAEAVAAITTEEAAIELTTTAKPGVLKSVGADAPDQLYIVMPMFKQQH
jgi:DNA polymerase-3 subunit beta